MKATIEIDSSQLADLCASYLAGGNPSALLRTVLKGIVTRNQTPGMIEEDREFNATVGVVLADLVQRVAHAEDLYYSTKKGEVQKQALSLIFGASVR